MVTVMVYSRGFQREGALGAWTSLSLTLVRNSVSTCELTVPAGHPQAVKLLVKGARVVVTDSDTGAQLFAGTVRGMGGEGPQDEQVTFTAVSDHRVLTRLLVWPDAALPLTQQPEYRRFRSVPLETVLKTVTAENASRLGIPITGAPSLDRGGDVTVNFRFHPVLDQLQAHLDASPLSIELTQAEGGVRLDVVEATELRKELSVQSGTLVSYSWDAELFDATRAIVGGQGDGAARELRLATQLTREEALGWAEEVFVDARDAENADDLEARGYETLAEAHDRAGLSLTLTQAPNFRYGVHYRLGDRVTVQTAAGPITDVIREVRITVNADSGQQITPIVGERTGDPDGALVRYVKRFAGRVSNLEKR